MRLNLPVQQVRPGTQRRGLTLIELIVVLMILIALAGVLIPMLPSMLTRAHNSTSATNLGEICRAITTYQQLNGQYPNNWDALTDSNGNLIDYFANGSRHAAGQFRGPGTSRATASSPADSRWRPRRPVPSPGVGITQLQAMVESRHGRAGRFRPHLQLLQRCAGRHSQPHAKCLERCQSDQAGRARPRK